MWPRDQTIKHNTQHGDTFTQYMVSRTECKCARKTTMRVEQSHLSVCGQSLQALTIDALM